MDSSTYHSSARSDAARYSHAAARAPACVKQDWAMRLVLPIFLVSAHSDHHSCCQRGMGFTHRRLKPMAAGASWGSTSTGDFCRPH